MKKIDRWLGRPIPVLWLSRGTVILWSGILSLIAASVAQLAEFPLLFSLFLILGFVLLLPLVALFIIDSLLRERRDYLQARENQTGSERETVE